MNQRIKIKTGATVLHEEEKAVQELHNHIYQPDMEAVIFFCSATHYNLEALGEILKKSFPCTLIGCTTTGEISSCGYQDGGIVAASLSSPELKVHPHIISPLKNFSDTETRNLADLIRKELSISDGFDKKKMFGFLMIDGLSGAEEKIIAALYNYFEWIPIIGGSAGDNTQFRETRVYYDGGFLSDAALITIFETTLPFHTFKTQHFLPTDKKVVITGAAPLNRVVTEINAEPAAREYARLLGLKNSDIKDSVFSKYPLMLRIGDEWHVRSIQKVNHDDSLTFFSAIDVGLVLTIGEGDDIVKNFKDSINRVYEEVPHPALIIGCDCCLRKTEIIEKGLTKEMNEALKGIRFIGFNTYGEQYNSVHVNQTLTGVAIGE